MRVSCACYGKVYPSVPYVGSLQEKDTSVIYIYEWISSA